MLSAVWQAFVASSAARGRSEFTFGRGRHIILEGGVVVISSLKALRSCGRGLITEPEGARSHANPLPKAFTGHVREIGATSPESIAADIAAIIEKVAALAVAEIAKHGSQTVPGEPRYYTSTVAADYLRCCVGRIYNLSLQAA
jgi:hypothetical protein